MIRTIFPEDFIIDEFILIKPLSKRRRVNIKAIPEVQNQGIQEFQGGISPDF